jgi:transcriptional regulator with XRE-family HTH domain
VRGGEALKDKAFGDRLKKLRKDKGLNQFEVSAALKIGHSSVQRHEAGNWPSPNVLDKYILFYECDRGWLLSGRGDPYIYEGEQSFSPPARKLESVLKDSTGLYARTKEKVLDGVPHVIREYEPEGEVAGEHVDEPTAESHLIENSQQILARLLKSSDLNMISAITANLSMFDQIRELKEENTRLKAELSTILDVLARHAMPPEQENRLVMKELYRVVDGNTLLSRLKPKPRR